MITTTTPNEGNTKLTRPVEDMILGRHYITDAYARSDIAWSYDAYVTLCNVNSNDLC